MILAIKEIKKTPNTLCTFTHKKCNLVFELNTN